jgi:hypothetical protein
MRTNLVFAVLMAAALAAGGWAADDGIGVAEGSSATLSLDFPNAKTNEIRLARVTGWIRERAPSCPPDLTVAIAQQFLAELQESHPEQLDRLPAADFPVRDIEPALLRQMAAQLKGSQWADLREVLARRRIAAVLESEGAAAATATADAGGLIAKIKDVSQVQYRRLIEGRMEEDDLVRMLKKARSGDTVSRETQPEQAKTLTAAMIVSEFSRHNQVGAALQRLRAYTIEARLKTASGKEQHLLLFKMRPDRFRLAVLVEGTTQFIVAGDGQHFWQQAPGQPPQIVPAEKIGERRYMGEFIDPLFAEEGFSYERLADGALGGQKFYRIAVRRADASGYVAQIAPETYREIGREDSDGLKTAYSDFRQVAGITFAFREEAVDREGRKGVLELTRVTPNPGLIQDFFEPDAQGGQSYFAVEQLLPRPPSAVAAKPPAK